MRNSILAMSLSLLIAAPLLSQPSARRPMTVDDALDLIMVGDALMSPDGEWVLYSRTNLDWENNKRKRRFYRVTSAGGEAFQFIGDDGGSSFQFSPDGAHLAFKRRADEKEQIFIMSTIGGEAVQLTKHKTSVGSFRWSHDSSTIFFEAAEARDEEKEKRYKAGDDAIFVDEGPNGQTIAQWENIWSFDLKAKEEKRLTNEDFMVAEFAPSPDSGKIAIVARHTNRRNDRDKEEIYIFDTGTTTLTQITQNQVPEEKLVWAPDGKTFAFMAGDDQKWLNRNLKIYLMNPETKEHRLISAGLKAGTIRGELTWIPDSDFVLFTALVHTNFHLFKINASNGDIEQLTDKPGSLRPQSFSRDCSKMVYTFSDFDTPGDLYVSEIESLDPVRLTHSNPGIERDLELASMKVVKWRSVGDFEVEGLIHLPADYREGDRLPMVLHIHGGPSGFFANSFSPMHHIYAGLGYASLSPNVRGSMGYTDAFREGNCFYTGDGIGIGDFQDLMHGVDHVIESGVADPEKLGVTGHSYGAILGGFTITQTDRFKAAALGDGVYDWSAEYGPGYNWDVRLWHIGGTPWDNPEAWRRQSTITHVQNVKTPTLLIHGMNDRTTTEPNSMMLFTALRDIGRIPVRYVRLPREGHFPIEPRHTRTYYVESLRWMQKYVRGIEWDPDERPDKKKD